MNFKSLFDQYLEVVNRFVPKPTVLPVVGIDIGTSAIKALDMHCSFGNISVDRWAFEPLAGQTPSSALKKVVQRLALNGQTIVSCVSGKGSMTRYIQMPRMPLEDLRKSLVFEMDKYFPFDPQTIYTDCVILDPESSNKKMLVLLAAVKKEMVDERLTLFKEVGLELDLLTLNSIALANAFSGLGSAVKDSNNAKAVMDIGSSVSSLLILKGPSVCFSRDIFTGSEDWTKQIANTLGIDLATAEALKCNPQDKRGQILDACDTSMNNLITEIRLSMDYFMNENNVLVDELFLSGGGSLLGGIEGIFEKNLGIRVTLYNPLAKAQVNSIQQSGDIQAYAEQLTVALGLGCHG